jgi:ankyrin repeat protein
MADVKTFQEHVKSGNLDAVKADLSADPTLLNTTNEAGQCAFLLAKYYRQPEVADYLLGLKPKLDVFTLCVAGHASDVLKEIENAPELLEAHSCDGWTPLHLAAFFGWPELANALIDKGAVVDSRSTNSMKNTPLHAAAAGGVTALVDLLLKRGANPNLTQEGGWTALHAAAQSGNRSMAGTLLANGANINQRADNNQTPLDMALLKGHQDLVELLEQLGAKLQ